MKIYKTSFALPLDWIPENQGGAHLSRELNENVVRNILKKFPVEKVVTFTKVEGDYYFMSVFPESEIEDFKETSRILARNGLTRTAKRLGIF